MTRQGSLNGNLRRFDVSNFADHDDVGILAQNGPEQTRKIQPDLRFNLNLVNTCELIFDRVFHGHDLARHGIDLQEACVEGRGLAAAGRPSDEDDPVGQGQR